MHRPGRDATENRNERLPIQLLGWFHRRLRRKEISAQVSINCSGGKQIVINSPGCTIKIPSSPASHINRVACSASPPRANSALTKVIRYCKVSKHRHRNQSASQIAKALLTGELASEQQPEGRTQGAANRGPLSVARAAWRPSMIDPRTARTRARENMSDPFSRGKRRHSDRPGRASGTLLLIS
jgi:hypothetical protein